MKIAILHCRRSSNVCTGAACFRAFNACEKSFQQYAGQVPTLRLSLTAAAAASTEISMPE